ncbi:MAG: hypothetical protein R3D00_28995 [Bacteroidia bacterium]
MKKLLIFPLLLLALTGFANVAQPGFWNAGGTGTFSLLFPEDSAAYKKIQMVKEQVSIQLYRGYAVIKGSYFMFNDTEEPVSLRVGYPLNASFDGNTSNREEVRFDSLYALKAYINGQPAPIIAQPLNGTDDSGYNDNWYIWNTLFPPGDTTLVEVYFIVNTNETSISKGYDRDHNNGFIYLLETGATWKQPIVQGEIRLRLMDNLTAGDLKGVSPDSAVMLHSDARTMLLHFQNLSPTGDDNLVIAYTPNIQDFDFASVVTQETALFRAIDQFATENLQPGDFLPNSFGSPFDVSGNSGRWIGVLFFVMIYGIPFLAIFVVIVLGYQIFRLVRNRKKPVQ